MNYKRANSKREPTDMKHFIIAAEIYLAGLLFQANDKEIKERTSLQIFQEGEIETLHVSTATYNKARKGKPKVLTLQKGGFGLPVITKGL